jgi:hypothetical protein
VEREGGGCQSPPLECLAYRNLQRELPATRCFLEGKHELNDINHFVTPNMTGEAFAAAGLPIFPVTSLVYA